MKTQRRRWLFWGALLSLPPGVIALYFILMVFNVFHAHEHCIKQAGLAFFTYASEHEGRFPYDTNGFGNALLVLVKGGYLGDTNGEYSIGPITGPGDNGEIFRNALKTGAPIPEEKCSRIYIQGFSRQNNPAIAILFDKHPTRGGDHFRRPWGPPLRELCLVDGSMQVVAEGNWPAFASNQVELLIKEGMAPSLARHYYEIR